MGTTLVRDLLFRASSQLNDLSPQFTRWKQRELVDACNDGQRAIAKYIPSSSARVDAVKLVAGSKQSIELILAASIIPGNGAAAANVNGTYFQTAIRNMGANGATPGNVVRVIDREVLDTGTPDWHVPPTGTYAGVRGVVFDPRFPKIFYVWPAVPAGTTWWLEQSMLADPVLVPHAAEDTYVWTGSDATATSIDDKYVDDLLNYIMARAFMKDAEWAANPAMAQNYTSLFVGSINVQVAALTGVNPNLQSLPFNPNVPAKGAGR